MHSRAATSILLATLVLTGSACSFDKRKSLAYEVLFAPDGTEREEVFYAALRERFKAGAQLRELETFAAASQGECSQDESEATVCEIPIRGGFCWARLLRIEARSADGTITSTKFMLGGLGC